MDPFTLLLLAGAGLFLVSKTKPVVPRAPAPVTEAAPAPSAIPQLPTALAAIPLFVTTQLVGGIIDVLSGPSPEEIAAQIADNEAGTQAAIDYIDAGRVDSMLLANATTLAVYKELVVVFHDLTRKTRLLGRQLGFPTQIQIHIDKRRILIQETAALISGTDSVAEPILTPVIAPVTEPIDIDAAQELADSAAVLFRRLF